MHPIFFKIGEFTIYSYGVMVALGFATAVYLSGKQGGREGISSQAIFDVCLYSLLSGVLGARILHVIMDLDYYMYYPLDLFRINRGGLAFQGGLISGIAAAWYVIRKKGMPLWKTADVIMPYLALGQSIGRIGCILNGCCYGKPTYCDFGFYLPGHVLQPLHPTQLYASLYLLFVFVFLKFLHERRIKTGSVFFCYLILFSAGRFFIDFYRGDLAPVFYGLTASQIISISIFFVSLILLLLNFRKK